LRPTERLSRIIAVANAHKNKLRLAVLHGAKLSDPDKLFGNAWRAIDRLEVDKINERAPEKTMSVRLLVTI
jgi:hypothetical protein